MASHKFLHITDHDLMPNAYQNIGIIEPAARLSIMLVSVVFIFAMLVLSLDKKILILTTAGRNSLAVYLIHRPFTMVFYKVFGGYSQAV